MMRMPTPIPQPYSFMALPRSGAREQASEMEKIREERGKK
jgi:hypothetical protein